MKKRRAAEAMENGILEGKIWHQLLIFFFPILLGTFFQQLYNTVDVIIVGKYVGKEALAAVGGSTSTLITLIVGFFVGVASGASVIISQFYGGKKFEDVSHTVHTAMAISLLCGAVLTVAGWVLTPWMLAAINTPEDVMALAITYMRIYFLGMGPSLIYNVGAGILRAVGDSRRPLYFLVAACLTNILLDVLFVMGMDMGVAGAAWATTISQVVSAGLVMAVLMRSQQCYQLKIRQLSFHPDLFKKILAIGLPTGLQSVAYSISNVLIQRYINDFGTTAAAAMSAWSRMDGFHWMVMNAFGISITTFVGQNFGAGKIDRVKKGVKQCLGMAFCGSIFFSVVLMLFGNPLFHLFIDDGEVIAVGMEVLYFIAPFYFTYVCIEILSGAVRGAGDTLIPTLMTLGGICLLRVVWLLFIVPQHNTLNCVVLSYPVTWTLTSLLFIVYYAAGGWLKRCQKKNGLHREI